MKRKILTSAISAIVLVASSSAMAAKDDKGSQGASNGQPFQELYSLIDENRVLIDNNIDGIQSLQNEVIAIGSDITGLASDLLLLDGRVTINEIDIEDLQSRVDGLDSNVASLVSDLDQLRINHDADIVDIEAMIAYANQQITSLQNNLTALTLSLNSQLASISASVGDNAIAIDSLVIELASTTALALSNLLSINGLQTQVDGLEFRADQLDLGILDLQAQIDALDARLTVVETASPENYAGLCFSFTNTAAEDLVGGNWFDACVDAVQAGGTSVRVVLRDVNDDIVYNAVGGVVGNWTYNNLTTTSTQYGYQYGPDQHDRLISLDTGHTLMITGKAASNAGCLGDRGRGYVITVDAGDGNLYHQKMLVTTYNRPNSTSARSFVGNTPAHEITWAGGANYNSCGNFSSSSFEGKFEFYVN